ncbi:MAG: zinc-ribbon domain-containing protein [Pseudomonadota bacterium]
MSEIECPSCAARYRVPASAIGADGRRVQCAKCGEVWFAKPIDAEAEPEAGTVDTETAEVENVDAEAAAAERRTEEDGSAGSGTAPSEPANETAETETAEIGAEPEEVDVSAEEQRALGAPAASASASVVEEAGDPAPQGTASASASASDAGVEAETEADAGEATGGQVATLPSSAPRRRRRWRDLRRDGAEEGDPDELDDVDDELGGGDGEGAKSDPFAERLARLRQASLAPDPLPRGAQESAIRRRRSEDADEDHDDEPDFAAIRRNDDGDDDDGGLAAAAGAAGGATAARAALEAAEADAPADGSGDPRSDQMAEIRRMLDEMKVPGSRGEDVDLQTEKAFKRERDVAGIEKMAPSPAADQRRSEDYVDPLREKLLDPQVKAKRSGADGDKARAGLMRKHQKRTRRRQVAEKTRRSRGGFYTGLILIIAAFGMLAGVYAFADTIKEKLPGTTAAINDYVATVDAFRASLDRRLVSLEKRVDEIIKVMSE